MRSLKKSAGECARAISTTISSRCARSWSTSLLELRRKAEAESAGGVRNSALLDAKHPGWRDELPIYVPAEDEALVAELLTGLLDEKMTGLTTEGVEVRRYLVKRDGEWRPALQLLADGEIPPAKLPGVPATSRARAIATGELGNHLVGEVALFEPPIGEQRRWRVRPYMRTAKLLTGFPFSAPVTTTVSSPDCVPYSWTWPRGDALRSDVLVFEPDEGSTPNEPLLRFFRAGSVNSPAKTLYVLVPHDWAIEPATEGAVMEIEDVPSLGRKLAHLTAAAYFHSGEDDAVRFRVEPDSDEREHELQLSPLVPDRLHARRRWMGTDRIAGAALDPRRQKTAAAAGSRRAVCAAPGRQMDRALRAAQRRRPDGTVLARPGRKHPDREAPVGTCAERSGRRRHHEECAQW